jgi:hypothetical protein
MNIKSDIERLQNPALAAEEIAAIALRYPDSKEYNLWKAIVKHPHTPPQVLWQAFRIPDIHTDIKGLITRHPKVPIELLWELARRGPEAVRNSLAENTKTPAEILLYLCEIATGNELQLLLAGNASTPAAGLHKLALNGRADILRKLVDHPLLTHDHIIDRYVEANFMDWIKRLGKDFTYQQLAGRIERPNLSDTFLRLVAEKCPLLFLRELHHRGGVQEMLNKRTAHFPKLPYTAGAAFLNLLSVPVLAIGATILLFFTHLEPSARYILSAILVLAAIGCLFLFSYRVRIDNKGVSVYRLFRCIQRLDWSSFDYAIIPPAAKKSEPLILLLLKFDKREPTAAISLNGIHQSNVSLDELINFQQYEKIALHLNK